MSNNSQDAAQEMNVSFASVRPTRASIVLIRFVVNAYR
jgi:hypothetical protein